MTEDITDDKQHSQRKRQLADRYAMSNVMRDNHMSSIRERAQAFMSRCIPGASVDVYVRNIPRVIGFHLTRPGAFALLCPRLRNKLHVQPAGFEVVRR